MAKAGGGGLLVLVVGPSGSGKDTMIAGGRRALAHESGLVFPRREITRAPGLGGEDYLAVSQATFARRRAAGKYSLDWQANDLAYGIPSTVDQELAAGRVVVVNVSRTAIETARSRYPGRVRIVLVTAPVPVLAARLRGRGREDAAEITERLARVEAYPVAGEDVATLCTDRPTGQSIASFVELLRHFRAASG